MSNRDIRPCPECEGKDIKIYEKPIWHGARYEAVCQKCGGEWSVEWYGSSRPNDAIVVWNYDNRWQNEVRDDK